MLTLPRNIGPIGHYECQTIFRLLTAKAVRIVRERPDIANRTGHYLMTEGDGRGVSVIAFSSLSWRSFRPGSAAIAPDAVRARPLRSPWCPSPTSCIAGSLR